MTRLFAGIFDPRGRGDASLVEGALSPHVSTTVTEGPLRLAFTGSPSASRVPMCWFDGHLDNGAELCAELDIPRGAEPEELLAAGWRRWRHELPSRIRGDFVLVIWDSECEEGLIARDQLGVRSMFVHDEGGHVCFATEVRFLLPLLQRRPPPDPVGVAHWIGMSGRPGPGTLYLGVRRLEPGAMLRLGARDTCEQRYWIPRFVEPLELSARELAVCVRETMTSAVRRRVDPTGGTGVMMSGGLDSASVAALAAEQAPGRVSAYSAAFPEHLAVDESALITQLRGVLKIPGVTAEVRAGGLVASALEATRIWELPLSSWGDFWATPLLRAAASAGVKVMLGGDGGDELFGARCWLLSDRLRSGQPRKALALARELPGAGERPPRRELATALRDFGLAAVTPYRASKILRRPFATRRAPSWMRARTARDLADSSDPFAWRQLDGPNWWASTAHLLTRGVEEAGVFEHHRHRATAAGLDARHPLFDLEVLDLALRQPPELTFDRHRDRPIMRSSMDGLLPDAIRLRPNKALFDEILVDALAGADRTAVRQLIGDPKAELGAYVDLEAVRPLLPTDDMSATYSFRRIQQLWRLVTLECWLRAQATDNVDAPLAHVDAARASVALERFSLTP